MRRLLSVLLGSVLAVLAFAVPANAAGLQIMINADQPFVSPLDPNGYQVTIHNPNVTDVVLTEYHQHLADHGHGAAKSATTTSTASSASTASKVITPNIGDEPFTYRPGTTTGFTTADPVIVDTLELYWRGAWTVPADGSISLHFGVTSAGMAAIFYTRADGQTTTVNVPVVKKLAPIQVSHAGPVGIDVVADETKPCRNAVDGYTITATNGADTPFRFSELRLGLPSGFRLVSGTSSGFVGTADPRVGNKGQTLRWTGPYTIPAHGALTMHFQVNVGSQTGSGLIRARLEPIDSSGQDIGTGPVAPVRVVSC
jgi:hypothetical protein